MYLQVSFSRPPVSPGPLLRGQTTKARSLFAILAVAGLSFPLFAQSVQQIARRAFPSVVLLALEDASGEPISLGSGFFLGEGVVATNLHVIEGAASGYAKIVGQGQKYNITGILAKDSAHDLVLLAITDTTAPALPLGESPQVSIGDQVYVVGNPLGLEGTFSTGIISGIRQLGADTLLQITAPISPGSSGGPVLDAQGRVIGVAVATFRSGQNLNFAIPASYLSVLLSHRGTLTPLSTGTRSRAEKSLTSSLGGPNSGGLVGSQFTWKATNLLAFYGDFSFSLRNQLQEPVKNVDYVVVFYDRSGKPIETYDGSTGAEVIPASLAKRETGSVDDSVRPLTTRVDIRVLDFKFANEAVQPVEAPRPQVSDTETAISIPREWINSQEGNTVSVRLLGDYVYEQGAWADGRYIQEGSFICDTKRRGTGWAGKCRYKLLLREGYLVSPKWCDLELNEVISSISPQRIEGESQDLMPGASAGDCPLPGTTKTTFALIPRD